MAFVQMNFDVKFLNKPIGFSNYQWSFADCLSFSYIDQKVIF